MKRTSKPRKTTIDVTASTVPAVISCSGCCGSSVGIGVGDVIGTVVGEAVGLGDMLAEGEGEGL